MWGQFEYQFASQISIHLILKGQVRINTGLLVTMQLNLQLARVWRLVSPGTTFCKRQSIYSWMLRIIEIKMENHHFRENAFKTIEKTI